MSAVVKTCGCGSELTAEAWSALPFVGIQDLGEGERAELRNHDCGSTIAIELSPGDGE